MTTALPDTQNLNGKELKNCVLPSARTDEQRQKIPAEALFDTGVYGGVLGVGQASASLVASGPPMTRWRLSHSAKSMPSRSKKARNSGIS